MMTTSFLQYFYGWLIAMEDPFGKKEEKVVGWQQSKAQISVGY